MSQPQIINSSSSAGHPKAGDARIWPKSTVPRRLCRSFCSLPRDGRLPNAGGVPAADLVQNRPRGIISVSLSLLKRLRISLSLPVTLFQTGELPAKRRSGPGDPTSGRRVTRRLRKTAWRKQDKEDLRFAVKAVLYRYRQTTIRKGWVFSLGLAGDLTVPTGNADSYWARGCRRLRPDLGASTIGSRSRRLGSIFSSMEHFYNAERRTAPLFGLQVALKQSQPDRLLCDRSGRAARRMWWSERLTNARQVTAAFKAGYHDDVLCGQWTGTGVRAWVFRWSRLSGCEYAGVYVKRPTPPHSAAATSAATSPPAEGGAAALAAAAASELPPGCEVARTARPAATPGARCVKGQKL